jgi:hypothetical protein
LGSTRLYRWNDAIEELEIIPDVLMEDVFLGPPIPEPGGLVLGLVGLAGFGLLVLGHEGRNSGKDLPGACEGRSEGVRGGLKSGPNPGKTA